MTKQELEQKIKELENQIAELKNAKVEDKVWKPKEEERYWYVTSYVSVDWEWWHNENYDIFNYEQGNCFKTREEAEEHLKKLTIQGKFKTYVREHSDELDWKNSQQEKWYLDYDKKIDEIECESIIYFKKQGTTYASSEQILKDAIEYIGGEEVAKKYLFD